MPDGSVPILIALVVLVLLSGFFSSTETAYSCANRIKLRSLATSGNKRAKQVLDLAETNYDKLISTILIGNNIVNIVATTLATVLFGLVFKNDPSTANIVSTVVMTISILIFGEITPKLIAKTYPEKMAMLFYPAIKGVYYLLYLLNLVFSGWKWLISKIFRFQDNDIVTEAEIMTIVEEAEEDGTLKEETELIRSVIEFDDLEVGDILVPRVNIVAVDFSSSMDDIKRVFAKEGYSRLPVYKDSIDTIVGTIHEKDFYNAYLNGRKSIDGILQNVFYTTEHAKISDLLKQLQKKKLHIAIVLDEYGGTLGLITMEDILEELVGEIYDEHDEIINYFKDLNEETCIVDGNAPITEFFEKFELEKDESLDANTLSGFIIELLGIIPHAGYQFEYKNLTIEVLKSTVKRVLQVKISVNPEAEEQTNE